MVLAPKKKGQSGKEKKNQNQETDGGQKGIISDI